MKSLKFFLVALLASAVIPWGATTVGAGNDSAQTQGSTALERGYRTGYSDGYNSGYKDMTDRATNDYQGKEEYQHANRAYVDAWGPIEDYRDGYQQGYEAGYGAAYERRPFESSIPAGFKRRGTSPTESGNQGGNQSANQTGSQSGNQTSSANQTGSQSDNQNSPPASINDPVASGNSTQPPPPSGGSPNLSGTVLIPSGATLLIELQSSLSTDVSQRGDRFQGRVVGPTEYQGAMVSGHLTRVQRPGKVKGTAQLQLSFDEIRLPDNRTSNLHAVVVEVLSGSSNSVAEVDSEGGVKGKDSTKDDVTKVGAATGIGAIIGAIVGGGKGAAIGAGIGAGVGTGGVLSSSGKDLRLDRGQQLRIRTSADTSIQ